MSVGHCSYSSLSCIVFELFVHGVHVLGCGKGDIIPHRVWLVLFLLQTVGDSAFLLFRYYILAFAPAVFIYPLHCSVMSYLDSDSVMVMMMMMMMMTVTVTVTTTTTMTMDIEEINRENQHRLCSSSYPDICCCLALTLYGHIKTAEQRTTIQQYDDWHTGR